MNPNESPFQVKSIGLLSPPLSNKGSIMQMKLLEEEALRHFPQMNARARALYVSHSIEQANKLNTND